MMLNCVIKKMLVVFSVFSLLVSISSCGAVNADVYMFSDLKECDAIEQRANENIIVEVYDSPKADKHLDNAEYDDFYACMYSGEFKFELYAYVFADCDTAKSYYQRVTGQPCEQSFSYSSAAGMSNYERTVIKDNLVYTVRCDRSDANAVNTFLSEIFTINLS